MRAYLEMSRRNRSGGDLRTRCLAVPWVSARVHFTDADPEAISPAPPSPQAAHPENAERELKGSVFFHSTPVPSGVARKRRGETRFLSTGEEVAVFPSSSGVLSCPLPSFPRPGGGDLEMLV